MKPSFFKQLQALTHGITVAVHRGMAMPSTDEEIDTSADAMTERRWQMRQLAIALAALVALLAPGRAFAQGGGHIEGFGGMTFGDVTSASTFGGSVSAPLTSNIHIIGEAGQMTDLMPALLGTALDFAPVNVRLRAWYGEAGVRLIAGRRSGARPYAEATAGMARLSPRVAGFGSTADVITNTALAFLDTTKPLLGVGGGIILQGAPSSSTSAIATSGSLGATACSISSQAATLAPARCV